MFNFVSPIHKKPLIAKDYKTLACQETGAEFYKIDGIWRFIDLDRTPHIKQFVSEYETVRKAEGRTAESDFYQQLPFVPSAHPHADMWRQRALTYSFFTGHILHPLNHDKRLKIVDLGAGNGWLSNRLAEMGHQVAAVDLTVNTFDGLGGHAHYAHGFVPIQAGFDQLPLESGQFDMAVFNASLHYSADIRATLSEAFRILKPSGRLVVIDTPVYRRSASGEQMVAERESEFEQRFGFRSNALKSENFLTIKQIKTLSNELNVAVQAIYPTSIARRWVRRAKRLLAGKREAAEFPILAMHQKGDA